MIMDVFDIFALRRRNAASGSVDSSQQIPLSQKGANSGVATLDASGKVPLSQLSITGAEVKTKATQIARLALSSSINLQIVIQVDTSRVWGLNPNLDPSVLGNWVDMGSSTSNVSSVNGATGAVVIALPIIPTVVPVSTNGNITLLNNSIYDITSTAVSNSVFTLPVGTTTGDKIRIIVSCFGYSDSAIFSITGNINGSTNTVINNKSNTTYKFIWSGTSATWIIDIGGTGF